MNNNGMAENALANDMPRLILASSSPRRRELMVEAGYRFEVVAPDETAESGIGVGESPSEFVMRMAYHKAAAAVTQLLSHPPTDQSDELIAIGCDTVAECAGQILGKPHDAVDAARMLRLLSGTRHRVYSGLCLWRLPTQQARVEVARTTLEMDQLTELQLSEYLASGLWQGKAGAFGYQDRVGWLRIVGGSESNVVGLPLELLAEMLDPPR